MEFSNIIPNMGSWTVTGIAGFSLYILLCRTLRFRRRDKKHAEYPYKTREDLAKMTTQHAQEIIKYLYNLEFPLMVEKALQFALFKTYGIPTISRLLCETKQLSTPEHAPRRYADTVILIREFLGKPPSSTRANSAIARMNYLHSVYQRAGKISNDDMLYTLALFVLEVPRWVNKYEWRPLTEMEVCAFGTIWKDMAQCMHIDLSPLARGPDGWHDGLEFYSDIEAWANAYEEKALVPHPLNHQLAGETIAILLCDVPEFLKPLGTQVVVTLMDLRLRRAMVYDDPPALYPPLVDFLLYTRAFLLRHLTLPRPFSLRVDPLTDPDPVTGRFYQHYYQHEPWYVPRTASHLYGPLTLFRRLVGLPYPNGKKYKPEGYAMFEVGPQGMEKLGQDSCQKTYEELMEKGRGGCPFAV
ncbi:hypothetical protein CC78DRAFT_513155 [Lojkania enalia]|uniref:ER-bound oxygenase mpaB/mpaB'/Rubber oxygenase catalytic domain-containing protein n=1 Tax=Lojkania enalia TaxID=147567 RepID=A0A9P4KIF3_9PLEO|nr:hypothetical protein CC78DRAFT_513155 [Didymosphaeria enalia]